MREDFIERPRKNEKEGTIAYVKELLKQAREDRRSEDVDKLENLVRLLNTKKYGLIWEEHAEWVNEEMKTKIPVFVEDESKKIVGSPNSEDYNFLLEGDNLHSLHLLQKTHRGKIDIIYIDPPYNTGNRDFKYNDDYVDQEDSFRHSKWLSFMKNRLEIAKELLDKNGLIFISIDDYELAQLKLLANEIFGEENFIANIAVETSNGLFGVKAKHINKTIVKSKDYVLVYAMSPSKILFSPLYSQSKKLFDTHFTFYKDEEIEMPLSQFIRENQLFVKRSKQIEVSNTVQNIHLLMSYFEDINEFIIDNAENIYRARDYTLKLPDEILEKYNNGEKVKVNDIYIYQNEKGSPMYLYPFSRLVKNTDDYFSKVASSVIVGDLWKGFNEDMGNVGKEGGVKLSNGKKPLRLIKNILKISNKKDATVLDFFAGSGTTGHAVEQLNKEDGGKRKFIICTNNENNICEEITYKRLTNIQEELPHNLKYFKTDFVVKEEFPDVTLEYELLNYVTPLVELEFGVDISNPKVQVILSEDQLDKMDETDFVENSTLFFHPEIFFNAGQEKILRDKNITKQEIPNYYFGEDMWT